MHLARVFAHGPEKRFFDQIMRFPGAGAFRLPARGHDPEKWNPVFGTDHAQTEERPAALRRLGDDGQGARRAG